MLNFPRGLCLHQNWFSWPHLTTFRPNLAWHEPTVFSLFPSLPFPSRRSVCVRYVFCASPLADAELKRGRPLFLNKHRYNALKQLYLRHRVAQEVSAIRASSDRVIRENYY